MIYGHLQASFFLCLAVFGAKTPCQFGELMRHPWAQDTEQENFLPVG